MSPSTSCNERAERLLRVILAGGAADLDLARSLARDDCSGALFGILIEGLADRFDRRLCDVYAQLFAEIIGDGNSAELLARYQRIRTPRVCEANPKRVFVLSRVTLGADIAVTSIVLRAAKIRFPNARIVFVGSAKNAELYPDVEHLAAPYPRTGSLRDRLDASRALAALLDSPDTIVLDPDSRLTQLGLLPVCDESRYFFFESRSYGGEGTLALSQLAAQWCEQILRIGGVEPYLPFERVARRGIAVSFGVGENPAKRLGDAFEAGLLQALTGPVLIDVGAGGYEAERVKSAIFTSGCKAEKFAGSFAGFAQQIAQSELYIGYDSAGQHAAAALGVPLIAVFRGQVSQRMFERWKPVGRGPIAIVNAGELTDNEALLSVRRLLSEGIFGDVIGTRE